MFLSVIVISLNYPELWVGESVKMALRSAESGKKEEYFL
jgi:hypothetical protein